MYIKLLIYNNSKIFIYFLLKKNKFIRLKLIKIVNIIFFFTSNNSFFFSVGINKEIFPI